VGEDGTGAVTFSVEPSGSAELTGVGVRGALAFELQATANPLSVARPTTITSNRDMHGSRTKVHEVEVSVYHNENFLT
jgi:hypothetical protein